MNSTRSAPTTRTVTTSPWKTSPVTYFTLTTSPTFGIFFSPVILLISTFYRPNFRLQAKSFWKTKYNRVPNKKYFYGMLFAMGICSKSLCSKHLRRFCGRFFVVSPYATRVYVKSLYTSVQVYTTPLWGYASHPKGDTSSPLARIAAYCSANAALRSASPGLPTLIIIVSSPPL